jgi:hypothetical protein
MHTNQNLIRVVSRSFAAKILQLDGMSQSNGHGHSPLVRQIDPA